MPDDDYKGAPYTKRQSIKTTPIATKIKPKQFPKLAEVKVIKTPQDSASDWMSKK